MNPNNVNNNNASYQQQSSSSSLSSSQQQQRPPLPQPQTSMMQQQQQQQQYRQASIQYSGGPRPPQLQQQHTQQGGPMSYVPVMRPENTVRRSSMSEDYPRINLGQPSSSSAPTTSGHPQLSSTTMSAAAASLAQSPYYRPSMTTGGNPASRRSALSYPRPAPPPRNTGTNPLSTTSQYVLPTVRPGSGTGNPQGRPPQSMYPRPIMVHNPNGPGVGPGASVGNAGQMMNQGIRRPVGRPPKVHSGAIMSFAAGLGSASSGGG
ncbi:hypothetical protein HDU76_011835, partial [Blyttiomyces sp. JEL0837]